MFGAEIKLAQFIRQYFVKDFIENVGLLRIMAEHTFSAAIYLHKKKKKKKENKQNRREHRRKIGTKKHINIATFSHHNIKYISKSIVCVDAKCLYFTSMSPPPFYCALCVV